MMLAYDEIDRLLASHTYNLSEHLRIPEACIDLLFFDLEEEDLSVLTRAVNQGILLINHDPRRFNKAVVQPALSLGVRKILWSQPYGR